MTALCLLSECTLECKSTYFLTYLLSPWNRVLLDKLTSFQLVKKFPSFYGTRRFITAFTCARHLSLSRASSIQSIPPHPTSWRSILILSSHLRRGLPSSPSPSGFSTKTLYTPLLHPYALQVPPISLFRFYHRNNIGLGTVTNATLSFCLLNRRKEFFFNFIAVF